MNIADTGHPREFEEQARFGSLLAELSSNFINLLPGDVDREIEDALRRVCEHVDIDFGLLWQWSSAVPRVVVPTHVYLRQDDPSPAAPVSQDQFPWVVQEMLAGRIVVLPSLPAALPAEAITDRANARLLGLRSNLTIPLAAGGLPPVGALALNTLRAEREWPDELVRRLRLVAEVFTNALARKRTDEALHESEALNRATFDQAAVGIAHVGTNGRWLRVNDKLCDVVGYSREQLLQLTFQDITHPDDLKTDLDHLPKLLAGEIKTYSMEKRYIGRDRSQIWVNLTVSLVRSAAGEPQHFISVVEDITTRKLAEQALRQSLAEIERLKDRLQAEGEYLKAEIGVALNLSEITGQSAAIQKVLLLANQVGPTNSAVLIHGETGTGKELLAQAIHRLSPRGRHVMVKVNCAALPSGLVESELFGREKGAFTGALTRQIGRFEVADGSTLFLDEVGELPPDDQVKLLRVLQEGEFERLGSPRTVKVDVRVIAATNRDLANDVRKGRFREDLYYRLNVFPIRMPPLRERAEDIPPMVWVFLEDFSSRMGKKITQVPRATMDTLQHHSWPGNVRELRNVIEHGAIITTGDTFKVPWLGNDAPSVAQPQTLSDAEREHILRTLESTHWRIKGPKGAAAALGLNPATLYSRMKKLGIRTRGQTEDAGTS